MVKRWLGPALFLFASVAFAAVETTTIPFTVSTTTGVPATGGTVTATLSVVGESLNLGEASQAIMRASCVIDGAGLCTLVLTPNEAVSPAGSHYIFEYDVTTPVAGRWTERRLVNIDPDPVEKFSSQVPVIDRDPGPGPDMNRVLDEGVPVHSCTGLNVTGTVATATWNPSLGTCDLDVSVADAVSGENYTQAISGTSAVLTHGLGTKNVLVDCYNASDLLVEPSSVDIGVSDPWDVTVTFATSQDGRCVVNGGSGGAGGLPNYSQAITLATEVLTHNLGTDALLVACYDASDIQVAPDDITIGATDPWDITVTFASAQTGRCVVNGTTTSGGGGSSLAFKTIDAPSGTDPVADSSTDTLTITASGSLTVTGDSATDTLALVVTETDAAHDNCSEITGCVPGAITGVTGGAGIEVSGTSISVASYEPGFMNVAGSIDCAFVSTDGDQDGKMKVTGAGLLSWCVDNEVNVAVLGDQYGGAGRITAVGPGLFVGFGSDLDNPAVGDVLKLTLNAGNATWEPTRYGEDFAATTTVTLSGTEHKLATKDLNVSCYDNSAPAVRVEPDRVTVNASTFDVIVTFYANQTGRCEVQ